ncbi:MAG: glycosyltransferase family 2 protein [Candidatus Woesebacteria bacterium]
MIIQSINNPSKHKTVTVGIPAFNEENNIGEIITRILSQKQDGFVIEKIIIDSDGSTDGTVGIANQYADKGVEVIDGKTNRGCNYRQNEIISKATSDALVLMNCDILLGNNNVISALVQPILNGEADLTAQWAKPLPPRTLLEQILVVGFDLKFNIYTRHKNGENLYTCVGHMRALSKKFYSKIQFPLVSEGEDQYLYLACKASGYKYKHALKALAFFRLPSTWSDYLPYAKRIFQTQKRHQDIFDDDLLSEERFLPLITQIRGCISALIKHPLQTPLYILLHTAVQRWALMQSVNFDHTYEISVSTKEQLSSET